MISIKKFLNSKKVRRDKYLRKEYKISTKITDSMLKYGGYINSMLDKYTSVIKKATDGYNDESLDKQHDVLSTLDYINKLKDLQIEFNNFEIKFLETNIDYSEEVVKKNKRIDSKSIIIGV